jgi:hypothetical protein
LFTLDDLRNVSSDYGVPPLESIRGSG